MNVEPDLLKHLETCDSSWCQQFKGVINDNVRLLLENTGVLDEINELRKAHGRALAELSVWRLMH